MKNLVKIFAQSINKQVLAPFMSLNLHLFLLWFGLCVQLFLLLLRFFSLLLLSILFSMRAILKLIHVHVRHKHSTTTCWIHTQIDWAVIFVVGFVWRALIRMYWWLKAKHKRKKKILKISIIHMWARYSRFKIQIEPVCVHSWHAYINESVIRNLTVKLFFWCLRYSFVSQISFIYKVIRWTRDFVVPLSLYLTQCILCLAPNAHFNNILNGKNFC